MGRGGIFDLTSSTLNQVLIADGVMGGGDSVLLDGLGISMWPYFDTGGDDES